MHGRVGPEFAKAWHRDEIQSLGSRLPRIGARVLKRPFVTNDYNDFADTLDKFAKAQPAHIMHTVDSNADTTVLKDNKVRALILGLLLDEDDPDTHMYHGTFYEMRRNHFEFWSRSFPLAIQAPHLAFRKISRGGEPFQYDARFTYILGASIFLMLALNHPDTPKTCGRSVLMPTKNGMYLGTKEPIHFHYSPHISRHLTFDRDNRKKPSTSFPLQKAWDTPKEAIVLRTTVQLSDCSHYKARLYHSMHKALKPAKDAGLMSRLCQAYISTKLCPLSPEDQKLIDQTIGAVRKIMESPDWMERLAYHDREQGNKPS